MYVFIKVKLCIIYKVCSLYGNHQKCLFPFEFWCSNKISNIYQAKPINS